jgi:glucokinase
VSAIGLDVGGTKIAAALVDESGAVVRQVRVPTPLDPDGALDAMVGAIVELDAPGAPVGVGMAGFVGLDSSTVVLAPNLGWRNEPLGRRLADRLAVPVRVENDANAAAWAEARFGAAAGRAAVVCVTVGTGVGGGVVTDGQLQRGGFGSAGEIGHLPVVPDGRPCGCGQRGCLEQYASGTALVRAARRALGVPDLDGPAVTELARRGDPAARALLGEIGTWLGVGLVALAAVLDPECFVIGGGVADAGEDLLGPTRDSFLRRLPGGQQRVTAEVLAARLGNDAGIIGAADLARAAVTAL